MSLAASLCAKPSNKLKWSKTYKFIGLEEWVAVWYTDLEGPLDTLKVTEVLGAQKHQNPGPFLLSLGRHERRKNPWWHFLLTVGYTQTLLGSLP